MSTVIPSEAQRSRGIPRICLRSALPGNSTGFARACRRAPSGRLRLAISLRSVLDFVSLRFTPLGMTIIAALVFSFAFHAFASDHADPVELPIFNLLDDAKPSPDQDKKLAGGITDLFVFPVDESDQPVLKGDQIARVKSFVFILCVRPILPPNPPKLELTPYTYAIHIDTSTPITFEPGATRARYGGSIANPEKIHENYTLRFQLNDDTTLKKFETDFPAGAAKDRIVHFPSGSESAIKDDPFIFPPFFRTNVLAMAAKVPIECFPPDKRAWIIWGTSSRNGRQSITSAARCAASSLDSRGFSTRSRRASTSPRSTGRARIPISCATCSCGSAFPRCSITATGIARPT